MKKALSALLCFCMALSFAGCGTQKYSRQLEAMDTFMQLDIYGTYGDVLQPLADYITSLDEQLSVTRNSGTENYVWRLNKNGKAEFGANAYELAGQALKLCEDTDGALDISILPVVEEWGFISNDYKIPSKQRLKELTKLVDHRKIKLGKNTVSVEEKGMKVDFGAVAKGYAADGLIEMIKEDKSVSGALLNLGGTVAAYGKKPEGGSWKIGITDPDNTDTYMGTVSCTDKIIATSGSYERYFEGDDGKIYSHIIDPKTGYPVNNGITSVTVISDSGLLSDGLSTALFVMGLDKAKEYYQSRKDFDFIILTDDKKACVTAGAAESFTLAAGYEYETVII